MKFGKLCEEACVELENQARIPPFPYKRLKKQLNKAEDAQDGRQEFARVLEVEMKMVDKAWKQAARSVIKSACAPRMSAALAHIGLGRLPVAAAPALAEWASLARIGLRKIKKKYNKRLGARFGPLKQEASSFAFVASSERTEIQALAGTVVGSPVTASSSVSSASASTADGSGAAAEPQSSSQPTPTPRRDAKRPKSSPRRRLDPSEIECPVCMETLFEPVAPQCGHAM